jgi:hypothetical protein
MARPHSWSGRLIRNILLWLVPAWLLWTLLTPYYNVFLLRSSETLLHLTEHPSVTELPRSVEDRDSAYVLRRDFPPARQLMHPFKVNDLHFHFVLLVALFLAVPDVPWRRRFRNLGWGLLATFVFDLFLVFFYVKAVYATELGPWSLTHYGAFGRNLYGLGKHLLDLPFKLSLPFALWAASYLPDLLQERQEEG